MHVRDLPARDRLMRARSALVTSQPFYGCLALHLDLVEDRSVPTMETDGRALFYAPAFVQSLSEPELIGVVAHEVTHLAYMHHVRRGGRDPEVWNRACDYAINRDLRAAGFALPAGGLFSPEFDGQGAEQIFATLWGRRQQPQAQAPEPQSQNDPGDDDGEAGDSAGGPQDGPGEAQDGEGEDGDGAPGNSAGANPGAAGQGSQAGGDPGGCGGIRDAAPDASGIADAAGEMESIVRQAIAVAAAGAGEIPGALARLLAELNRPRINWRETVERFIDDAASRVLSWSRPDKRFLGGDFYMPGRQRDSVGELAVVVDTSGSIDDAVLNAFASEVQGILDSGRVERVHVAYVDADVQGWQAFEAGDVVALEPVGGGGTRFDVAWRHLAEQAPDAAAIIYLTDLDCYGNAWGDEPPVPVLWCVWGGLRAAPFGEVVPLDPHA